MIILQTQIKRKVSCRRRITKQKKGERDEVGGGLLSQRVPPQLPSTLAGLTSGFEKGPGVPPPLLPPTTSSSLRFNEVFYVAD